MTLRNEESRKGGYQGLRSTTRRVVRREPTFEECEALVDAWADATLGYLNRLPARTR